MKIRNAIYLAASIFIFVSAGNWVLGTAIAESPRNLAFDHLRTGFPLTGAHRLVECETCHAGGRFKGTPLECAMCHVQGSHIAATAKSAKHFPTQLPCDQCHSSTSSWDVARFSHAGVSPGGCTSCHNGAMAPGRPANHVVTNQPCDACHRTTAWSPAGFNHAGVVPGTCRNCHNGSSATGTPANHMATTSSCDACHSTSAWLPTYFNHANVAPGTCTSCHNGGQASGVPNGHFVTTRQCDACHYTSGWVPLRPYVHVSAAYKPHNRSVTCVACHKGNTETVTWPRADLQPACAGCHAGDFKPDPHKKSESPTIFYTVDELKDCSGSCHMYTNDSFTTIKESRSGEHRSNDGGF